MTEFKYGTKEDLNKFAKHVPMKEDLLIQVLRGHLVIEEIIRDLFQLHLSQPEALKGISLDCHQVICLTEAITPDSQTVKWAWKAAKKLNNMRNDLSHQLEPKGLEHKVDDFIQFVFSNSEYFNIPYNEMSIPKHVRVNMMLIALCTALSSLK